jgi:hypothetical protein
VAAGTALVVLAWAAVERGRVRRAGALHRGLRKDAAALLAGGFDRRAHFGLRRAARHAWRAHLT